MTKTVSGTLPTHTERDVTSARHIWCPGRCLGNIIAPYRLSHGITVQRMLTCILSLVCKGLVINYGEGGGATKWENCGSETFCAPPPLKTG